MSENIYEKKVGGDPIDEYKECNVNMRHYSNMRFAQTSLFLIINGFLFNGVFDADAGAVIDASLIGLLGISLAFVFIIMQERRYHLWKATFERAKELEKDSLGFSQHIKRPGRYGLTSRSMTNVIYVLSGISWVIAF